MVLEGISPTTCEPASRSELAKPVVSELSVATGTSAVLGSLSVLCSIAESVDEQACGVEDAEEAAKFRVVVVGGLLFVRDWVAVLAKIGVNIENQQIESMIHWKEVSVTQLTWRCSLKGV